MAIPDHFLNAGCAATSKRSENSSAGMITITVYLTVQVGLQGTAEAVNAYATPDTQADADLALRAVMVSG